MKRGRDYAEVAALYLEGGRAPTAHVAKSLGLSQSMAGLLVAQTRARGLLPRSLAPGSRSMPTHRKVVAVAARGTLAEREWLVCIECLVPWPCDTIRDSKSESVD